MEIKNKVLISVSEADIVNGQFVNDKVIEVADWCFNGLSSLKFVSLPKVEKIGSYCFSSNPVLTSISLPALTTTGSDCFSSNPVLTSISLPALTTTGSDCFRYNDALASIELPALTTTGSDCFSSNPVLTSISLPALTTTGSYCFRYNDALASIELPALTTTGSYCFSSNPVLTSISLPALTTTGSYCFRSKNLNYVQTSKERLNVKYVDGYCFVVKSQRSSKGFKIYSGYNLVKIKDGKSFGEEQYVAEKDNFTAHGETVKKAIGDVQFKIVAEKLRNEPINEDTLITVKHYRLITGACDAGVREFMRSNSISYKVVDGNTVEEKPITAKELYPILSKSHAYGFEKFKSLITF